MDLPTHQKLSNTKSLWDVHSENNLTHSTKLPAVWTSEWHDSTSPTSSSPHALHLAPKDHTNGISKFQGGKNCERVETPLVLDIATIVSTLTFTINLRKEDRCFPSLHLDAFSTRGTHHIKRKGFQNFHFLSRLWLLEGAPRTALCVRTAENIDNEIWEMSQTNFNPFYHRCQSSGWD